MPFNKKERQKIFEKCNGKCAYCGNALELKAMQVDHIIPQSDFKKSIQNNWRVPNFLLHLTINDLNHIDNLLPTCRVCNKWKSFFDLELFRSEILQQVKRLNERSSNYRFAKRFGLVQEIEKPIIFYFESLNN